MATKIEGSIKKVIYSNLQNNIYDDDENDINKNMLRTYFVILLVLDKDFNEYKIKGHTLMEPEDRDIIMCNCNKDKNGDTYLPIGLISIGLPIKVNDIVDRFMSSNLKVVGFGKKMIDTLINKYKEKIWNLQIGENPNENKLIEKMLEYIYEKTKGQNDIETINHISNFMGCYYSISLTSMEMNKIKEIYDKININYPLTHDIVRQHILHLIGILPIEKLKKICMVVKINENQSNRMMILYELYNEKNNGNSCVIKRKFGEGILKEVKYLVDNSFICEYDEYLYLRDEYYYESQIAKLIFEYNCKTHKNINKLNDFDIIDNIHVKQLNSDQKLGVLNAFNNVFSVITGFPGVGKTTTVKSIKSICDSDDKNIVIIAPTGKVVLKIKNDLNDDDFDQVYTIHKFVNFLKRINSESYQKSKEKNLQHIEHIDMLVIDELSMVTNSLFYELFSEIKQCNMLPKVVFIGDVDQLPAIGVGNILHSLINSNCFPIVKLTKPMRNGGELYNNILRIREDIKPKFNVKNFRYIKNNCLEHCKVLMNNELSDLLEEMDTNFTDIMLITPTNANIRYLSDDVRKMVNKNYKGDDTNKDKLIIGDHVMMKINCYAKNCSNDKNNNMQGIIYDDNMRHGKCKTCNGCEKCVSIKVDKMKDLFNGMIGMILFFNNGYYKVQFENVVAYFNEKYITNYLRLSYVNTIHKYQGSENKIAIILLTDKDKHFVTKNMLYTAVSRAKERCIIISDDYTFNKSFERKSVRVSNLDKMLIGEFSKSTQTFKLISEVYKTKKVITNESKDIDFDKKSEFEEDVKPTKIIKNKTSNNGKIWSKEEDKKLICDVKKGIKFETIAQNYGRSVGAIKSRYTKITSDYYNNF